MLNLWLDPDDVIQGEDGDGRPRPPKRTVSDHFRPAKDDGKTEVRAIPSTTNLMIIIIPRKG